MGLQFLVSESRRTSSCFTLPPKLEIPWVFHFNASSGTAPLKTSGDGRPKLNCQMCFCSAYMVQDIIDSICLQLCCDMTGWPMKPPFDRQKQRRPGTAMKHVANHMCSSAKPTLLCRPKCPGNRACCNRAVMSRKLCMTHGGAAKE